MLRKAKVLIALLMGSLAAQQATAFSFYGPLESWQTTDMDYPGNTFQDFITVGLQLGGTKNLGEEYRIATPVITYAYDSTFLDYFGTEGVKAVDSAFAFMNTIPAVSKMSPDLSEFMTSGNQRINQRAQALFLIDMKSTMIQMLVEHMGLSGETHIFDLSTRICVGTCGCSYGVIVRNFDPITWEPSHYVNGNLWTYQINELCPAIAVAAASEVSVSRQNSFSAVATPYTLKYGGYFLSLTRDDMGGLRYLYRKNNFNMEPLPAGAVASMGVVGSSPWSVPSFWATATNTAVGGGTVGTGTIATNAPMLRGGIEKVTYVKVHFDSVLGTTFTPMTINYKVPAMNGYKVVSQSVTRTITVPDIMITAADFAVATVYGTATATTTANGASYTSTGSSSPIGDGFVVFRTISFGGGGSNTVAGLGAGTIGGPGIINPQMQITFNKMGPSSENDNTFFTDEQQTAYTTPRLAVFDGSTNDPIVFPSGASIRAMEAQLLTDPGQNQNIGGHQVFDPVIAIGQTNTGTQGTGNGP